MSLINLFKEFHSEAIQQEFPPSARVLYYTLLGEFNRAHWTDKLVLSERELIQLTGLPKTTINEAKRFLASRGIIKVTSIKNKTAYSLTDHRPTTSENSYIRVREDVKTLRQQTKNKNSSSSSIKNVEDDDIHDIWEYETGFTLNGSVAYELEKLANDDFELTRNAIIAAVKSKTTDRLRYNYFKAVYDSLKDRL